MDICGMTIHRDLETAATLFENDSHLGLDIETNGLNPWQPRVRIEIVQLYGELSHACAVLQVGGHLPESLCRLLSDPDKTIITHNGVHMELPFLSCAEINVHAPKHYDTLVAEAVLLYEDRSHAKKSLEDTLRRRLDITLDKAIDHNAWDQTLTPRQIEYAAHDVLHLLALREAQMAACDRKQQAALELEMQLIPVVAQMRINGLPVSPERYANYIQQQRDRFEKAEAAFKENLGDINPHSQAQVLKAFHDRGIDLPNTRKETFMKLLKRAGSDEAALAQLILDYREPDKRLRVYGEEFCQNFITSDQRIHPQYWQLGTDTGRFSSSNPNAQQLPRDMRSVFGNLPGLSMVSADFSQIEVITAFILARDQEGIAAYETEDIHRSIASSMFNIPPEEVTREQRQNSKAITFGVLFGGGTATILDYASTFGATLSETQIEDFRGRFFDRFSGLAEMQRKAHIRAQRPDPVIIGLPTGLRRVLDGSHKRATFILNTCVQGTAAAGLKYALLDAERRGLTKYLCGVVHDEILACVPDAEAQDYAHELQEAMITGMRRVLNFTVKVDVKIGAAWEK